MRISPNDDGKKIFSEAEPYSIKTTAEDILFAENSRVQIQKQRRTVSFKPFAIGLSSLGAAAIAATILVLFLPKIDNPLPSEPEIAPPVAFSPMENKTLSQELITFQAFGPEGNDSTRFPAMLRSALRGHGNANSSFSSDTFSRIVDGYETVQSGIRHVFDQSVVVTEAYILSEPFEYNGLSYDYEILFRGENGEVDAKLYYHQDSFKEDHHGTSAKMTGLYLDHDTYYYARIEQESETHSGKDETEVKMLLQAVEGPSTVFLIEHETEYRGQESEEAYSYSTFASLDDYEKDKGKCLSNIQIEWEKDRINVDIEFPDQEMEFTSIQQTDKDHYVFWVEEYEYNDEKAEDLKVQLAYREDSSRTYTCNSYIENRG